MNWEMLGSIAIIAVLAITRTRGGAQWWAYMNNVIGTDGGKHIRGRIDELGDMVPPWDEQLPHFRFKG